MNKAAPMALGIVAGLFAAVATGYVPQALAQYPGGGGSEPLTQQQLDFCKQYNIDPCTQELILAKQRLLAAEANPSTGSGTSMVATEAGQLAIFIGVLGAIFGGVAAAFFFKGRGSKPVTT